MHAYRVAVDDRHYTHTQSVPTTSVTVTHGLGKYPSVTVVDSSGREVESEVEHLSSTQTRINVSSAVSMTIYFN